METSIRLNNTNNNMCSSADDTQGRSTLPSSEVEGGYTQTGQDGKGEATPHPLEEAKTQPERVDIADFEAIFQRYQVPITNFIYHLIGNREQAYDLAQDVFVKAYKA